MHALTSNLGEKILAFFIIDTLAADHIVFHWLSMFFSCRECTPPALNVSYMDIVFTYSFSVNDAWNNIIVKCIPKSFDRHRMTIVDYLIAAVMKTLLNHRYIMWLIITATRSHKYYFN